MGSGGAGAPGKPTKIVKRAASKSAPKVVRKTAAPVTDVQSSGGDYGTKKAKAYQRTPAARKPVIVATPVIVRDSQTGKTHTVVVKKPYTKLHSQDLIPGVNPKSILHAALRGWNNIYGGGGGDESKNPGASGSAFVGPTLGGPQGKVAEAVKANAVEAYKHPGKTVKDLGGMVAGTVGAAGDVGLPLLHAGGDLVTGHPGRALHDVGESGQAVKRFATGAVKNYKYRYGPLVSGDYKAYEKRVHKTGAAAGLVDLATAATAGGAAVRPLVRGAVGHFPAGDEFLNAARPKLRTTGGRAVSQTLSRKPSRVVLQRATDRVRQAVQERPAHAVGKDHVVNDGTVVEARRPALQPHNPVRKSVERHNRKAVAKPRSGPKPKRPVVRKTHETVVGDGSLTIGHYASARKVLNPDVKRIPVRVPKRPEEVVPVIKSGPFDSFGTARAQRVAVSKESAKSYALNRHEQANEIAQGADRAIGALTGKQQRAVFHVVQGLLPIHHGLPEIKQALANREAQLTDLAASDKGSRLARLSPDGKGVSILRSQTELATVRYLRKHADEIFNPAGLERLRGFHAQEVARGKRISEGDPGVRPATQEARRYRPQGEVLGVKYDPPKPTVDNAAARDTYNQAYVAKVQEAAGKHGLPSPAYFKHEKRPLARLSNRSSGNLSRAVKGPKATDMRLLNEGRAITSPQAYTRGLRDTIKRKHQWPSVANVIDQHAFDWSRGPHGKGLTIEQLRDVIDQRRLRHEDVTFVSPGLVRSQGASAALEGGKALAALDKGTGEFSKTERYFALPTHAAKELLASTHPASKAARFAGRIQGLQSGLILGLNPSWPQMQLAANSVQSIVGVHGNLGDYIASHDWYRNLSPNQKRVVDLAGGIGVYEGHTNLPHMGSYQGALGHAAERIGQVPVFRVRGKAVRLTELDPRTQIFRFDNAQNNYFRRVVLYNALKKQAYKDLIANTGRAQTAMQTVSDMLRLKPGETVQVQLDRVLRDPEKVDQAARYVDSIMGDYLRFTHRERSLIKPAIMFYGFLRYATKTLFYTLPIEHPLAAEIALKLGQLHDDEIKRIFGNKDLPPWVYSRVFQYDQHGNVVRDGKTGLPLSIDLARINPLTGPATDVVSEGPKALFGLMSPIVQASANIASGRVLQQGRPIRVHGSPEEPKSLSLGDMARVGLNEAVSSTFPGRLLMPKGNQSDDALPGSPRPIVYKSAAAKAKDRVKRESALTGGRALEQQLLPLFVPRPDTSGITAAGGVTGTLDKQIKQLNTRAKAMRAKPDGAPGAATENGGYETRGYAAVRSRITRLEKERQKVLRVKPTVTRAVKQRPQTAQERLDARLKAQLDRVNNPGKAAQDRLNRQLERTQVQSGG